MARFLVPSYLMANSKLPNFLIFSLIFQIDIHLGQLLFGDGDTSSLVMLSIVQVLLISVNNGKSRVANSRNIKQWQRGTIIIKHRKPYIFHYNICDYLYACWLSAAAWYHTGTFQTYRQVSNVSRTLVGNYIVDHSDVVGASPVGAAPTTSSFSP